MPGHVLLLGDSTFDNKSYTGGEPDVASHLRSLLPAWKVTLGAIDGSTTEDVGDQWTRVAPDVSHIVLSVGGNDALLNADLLDLPVCSTAEALDRFSERVSAFETAYGYVVEALVELGRTLVVCTIYNGNFPAPQAERSRIALTMFDDVILRTALRHGLDVIELRMVCTGPEDFANPIEPSGGGGRKIATAIGRAIGALPEEGVLRSRVLA